MVLVLGLTKDVINAPTSEPPADMSLHVDRTGSRRHLVCGETSPRTTELREPAPTLTNPHFHPLS